MNNKWLELLPSLGGRCAQANNECTFDDSPNVATGCAAQTPVLIPLTHLGVIRVGGDDAASFLHNLLTNDVKNLAPGELRRNSFCSAKGRMIASFLTWREGPDILLQLSEDILPSILKKLSMYVLRAKVRLIEAGADSLALGAGGPGCGSLLASAGLPLPEANMKVLTSVDGVQVLRIEGERFMLSGTGDTLIPLWQRLTSAGFRSAGTAAWRWLEARNGIPLITGPLQEEFVPQMVNFELIGGVSFTKGCYPGQEIVARTKYLGKLKKRMFLAHATVETEPAPGTDVYSPELEGQSAGKVVLAAPAPGGGFDLLVVCQLASHQAGAVTLAATDGPRLTFQPLPYAYE